MPDFISGQHEACIAAFRALIQLLTTGQPTNQATSWTQLRDDYDRYQVWAVNVGAAFRGDDYKRSLDYRLRDATVYKEAILKILLRIESLTNQLSTVIRNIDQSDGVSLLSSSSVDGDEVNEDDNDKDSTWSLSSDDSLDRQISSAAPSEVRSGEISFQMPNRRQLIRDGPAAEPLLKVDTLLKSLNFSITSLYRIPVRQSANADQAHHLARRYNIDLSYYEPYDIAFVRDLFRNADEQVVSRLGRMVSRRRQVLRTRLQRSQELQRETFESVANPQWHQSPTVMPARTDVKAREEREDSKSHSPSAIELSLKATTFKPTRVPELGGLLHLEAAPSEVAESVSSIATTGAAQDSIVIPPRPTTVNGSEKEDFECPFCCMLVHVRSAHAWKKHVLHDLQPYICTNVSCNEPDRMFDDRELWYNHEIQHLSEYFCGDAQHPSFGAAAFFVSHMKEQHGFNKESQLHVSVLNMFLKPRKVDRSVCPLCLVESKDVKRHLGRHLQRIALFALPRHHGDIEDNEAASHGSNVAAAAARQSGIDREDNDRAGSDNDSGSSHKETSNLADTARDGMQNEAKDDILDEDTTIVPDCEPTTWEQIRRELHETAPSKSAITEPHAKIGRSVTFKSPSTSSGPSSKPTTRTPGSRVDFTPSPHPDGNASDEDADDDSLFAIPLTNKSLPSGGLQNTEDKASRPTLSVDTEPHAKIGRSVTFKPPSTSSGPSSGPTTRTPGTGEVDIPRSIADAGRSDSAASYSSSAQSPDEIMGRRDSFVSEIWANRPPAENVVDHLDEFFPGVDLDQPYLEESATSPISSTDQNPMDAIPSSLRNRITYGTDGLPLTLSKNEADTLGTDESTLKAKDRNTIASVTNVAERQISRKNGGLGRMKSIREVAKGRNASDTSRRPSSVAQPQPNVPSSIVRRKSTKMFGANIVQTRPKPGNRLSTLGPITQEEVPHENTPKRNATFKIIRGQLIGKGTYGRVYLGMNATTGEFLAVKQVEVNQKVAAQDKERVKEMVAALDIEIDTMQHLNHPNIVQYLGCERKEFSVSIYLEYISGGSIGSCLRKHGKFEESVIRSMTRQTLEGLAYLHAEGILHRDLKADNILLDLDGTCKISGFGISKKSDNIYGNDITNSMQGSVFWMAPEVVRSQGQGYSAKVDIWSLGCVVLEMFAGRRPWSREEAIAAIFKLGSLNQAPPIPDDVSATATVDGLHFMYDCFQIDPSDRPTADTLLRHSTFCIRDLHYNFYDTDLWAKLRTVEAAALPQD